MKAVLVGNYGVGNIGDEALKEYFLQAFPDVAWTVVSANPQAGEVCRLPAGLGSLFCPWWKTLRAMRSADAVVFGGGSLFTDSESIAACWIWWIHAIAARLLRVPYLLAFQGVGPFRSSIAQSFGTSAIRHAAFVSVRDAESALRIDPLLENKKCVQSFDPAIIILRKWKVDRSQKQITLIPRQNSAERFVAAAMKVVAQHLDTSVTIVLMHPDDPQEQSIAASLLDRLPNHGRIVPATSLDLLCKEIALSSMVVSERYHGALAALALDVPVTIVPHAPGDKLASLIPYANGSARIDDAVALALTGEKELRAALNALAL